MNKNNLKTYAPQARKDFIAAVKARANMLGLSDDGGSLKVEAANVSGDVAIIVGREWPAKVEKQRQALIKKMQAGSFAQTIEAIAYTWFNRFVALRYMELHDYLDHGFRVLSNSNGSLPEILGKLTELHLDGLDIEYAKQLKLAGNKDGELYRLLLIAQCNALSKAMPFMFEQIDDETELLLPDNLLLTDSIIAKLVKEISEEDWAQVEIIGWLYQFYISEKKDEVIGKVVKSEDIPAATQLFTPNWIVQYLVQNSVGRLWMMANPSSSIHSQWPYYIKPAEQTPEVNAQLEQIINTRIAEDGTTLNPESIIVLDPACGSGHILVEAYETLKQIYLERGYQPRAIPRLILENNLHGIDIDDRAAQLAGFALLMKARADDRRILQEPPKLNVISLQESKGLNADQLAQSLSKFGVNRNTIADLIDTFQHAKTFGSLIQIPAKLTSALNPLNEQCQQAKDTGDLFAQEAAQSLLPLITQAGLLARQYDVVIANPPYMGSKGMNPALKDYAKAKFPDSKSDLFAMFIEQGFNWCKATGFNSMVTMQSWMFLSSFEQMREKILAERSILSLVQIGYNSFPEINSKIAQACSFCMMASYVSDCLGAYVNLNDAYPSADKSAVFLERDPLTRHDVKQELFKCIPGSPIGYWASDKIIQLFGYEKVSSLADTRLGMATADNSKFLRFWYEVSGKKVCFTARSREEALAGKAKWFSYQKGGDNRKWYGNLDYVVNWERDGFEIQNFKDETTGKIRSHNYNLDYIFKEGVTWNALGWNTSARLSQNSLFDNAGSSLFCRDEAHNCLILAYMNSCVLSELIKLISPTLNYQPGDIAKLPARFDFNETKTIISNAKDAIELARSDWNSFETSWDFKALSFVERRCGENLLMADWNKWEVLVKQRIAQMKKLEESNNNLFLLAYDLQDEFASEVPESQITLTRADREKDSQRLVSYAIGCMMGRYSLDAPGLIYANAGNEGFDATKYSTYPADADGIVPITDMLWFEDDAANRVQEFLQAVWGEATLDENTAWLAESLGGKESETPIEAIRRYLSNSFYKDHLQTYKKRPIYWHFSSGKQGAFQALVYLHRYNEGTLARMRSEYVVPLMGKLKARIEMLEKDADGATSTAARNKLNKEIEQLNKKQFELQTYDEKLRHYADMRIKLDLDDGVKVNYGKFGDLLSDVKAITGGSDD